MKKENEKAEKESNVCVFVCIANFHHTLIFHALTANGHTGRPHQLGARRGMGSDTRHLHGHNCHLLSGVCCVLNGRKEERERERERERFRQKGFNAEKEWTVTLRVSTSAIAIDLRGGTIEVERKSRKEKDMGGRYRHRNAKDSNIKIHV